MSHTAEQSSVTEWRVSPAAPFPPNGAPSEPPPPRVTVASAARRYWWAVLIPVLLLTGAAGYYATQRDPTWTADARLAVGRIDPSTPGALAGFTSATQSLAETYSRSVRSDSVIARAAGQLDVEPRALRRAVSGATVPQTPVFRISANGTNPAQAVERANAVSAALATQVERDSLETPRSERLLRAYRSSAVLLDQRRATMERRRDAYMRLPVASRRRALSEARAEMAAVQVRVDSLKQAYVTSRQPQGTTAQVRVLERATAARSDRDRKLQLALFAGGVAGLTFGLALALLLAHRRARRAIK